MAEVLQARLADLVEREATSRGFQLVLLELVGSKRSPIVRVYLDHEGGITIDQIAEANHWIDEAFDPVKELSGGYTLEVSSPGIERPLVRLADFERFAGSEAKITFSPEFEGHKHLTGVLHGVEDETVLLDVDGDTVHIPHSAISRAHLRVQIDFSKEGTADDGL